MALRFNDRDGLIFILDERAADFTTYDMYRELSQSVLEAYFTAFPSNKAIYYLTFHDGSFKHVADGLHYKEFTRNVWYHRALPEQRIINLMCPSRKASSNVFHNVFLLVSDPEAVRPFVSNLFDCNLYCIDDPFFVLYEVHITDQRTRRTHFSSADCVYGAKIYVNNIQHLKARFRFNSFLKSLNHKVKMYVKHIQYLKARFRGFNSFLKNLNHGPCDGYEQVLLINNSLSLVLIFCPPFFPDSIEAIVKDQSSGDIIMEILHFCSISPAAPLIIRNQRELFAILNALISRLNYLADIYYFVHQILLGLFQTETGVGHKYTWAEEKDLLLSHWAPGEPRDIATKKCVVWKFAHAPGGVIDKKWHSLECDTTRRLPVLCLFDALEPRRARILKYTSNYEMKTNNNHGYNGQLLTDYTKKRTVFVSISATVASLYLYDHRHKPLKIFGLVANETLVLASWSDYDHLLVQLHPLFHRCGDDQNNGPHHLLGVPLSLVCDGKMDCQSGSDESSCGFIGGKVCNRDLFQCKSGQCVPLEARCDLLVDCQDRSDEVGCERECQHKECKSGQCLPRSWFHDGMMDCKDGSDEDGEPPVSDICVFICNRTKCVTKEMLNDSVVDCTGPEGPLDETLGALEPFTCTPQDSNSTYLEKWAPKCVLARDLFGQIIGCRDFQHLSNCESFTCPTGYVKCPNSFCIPLVNVKDGKEECEKGEDEETNPLPDLENYFQCNPWIPQAVPLSAVCDGKRDCPHGEDELDCGHHCPTGFLCLAGAVSAVRYDKKKPLRNLSFINPDTRYLNLSGVVGIHDFFHTYPKHHMWYLRSLVLSRCQIQSLTRSSRTVERSTREHSSSCTSDTHSNDFRMVKTVDLSHNNLTILPRRSYLNLMFNLEELSLANNVHLSVVSRESFTNMKRLKMIDLSFTGLTRLKPDVWDELASLEKLSLKGTGLVSIKFTLPATIEYFDVELTNIVDVGGNVFGTVRDMRELRSSTYKLCCPEVLGHNIPTHICSFTGRTLSSCQELIKEPVLRIVVWLVGLSTIVGNAVTLVYRLVWEREVLKKPYGLFVTNLGVSDFLMGVYLATIAIADAKFYGKYVIFDYTWRYSQTCHAAGVLVTMSSLTSILFISLITVERYLAVRYPYGEFRLSDFTVKAAVLGAWMFGLTAAVIPLMPFARHWKVYSSNGMCVALPLSIERRPGQWYGATLFVGVDFILFIFIGVGQGIIYKTVKEKGKRTRKHSNPLSQLRQNQRIQEFTIAKQLSLVVMTDFLCWFPIITMGLMALSGVDMGDAAYRWSALLVLPINSALNPMLYTVPEIRKRWEDYKESRREAKMLVVAARRRRRFRLRSVAKKASRRQLVRKICRAMIKIRQHILTKPEQIKEPKLIVSIQSLHSKVIELKGAICSKQTSGRNAHIPAK